MEFKTMLDVTIMAEDLIKTYLPSGKWSFGYSESKRAFGHCSLKISRPSRTLSHCKITLSRPLTLANLQNATQIYNTILHEIGHAICYEKYDRDVGHGELWKYEVAKLGGDTSRCYDITKVKVITPYKLVCPECHAESGCIRIPKRNYSCAKCSPRRYNPQYKLIVIKNDSCDDQPKVEELKNLAKVKFPSLQLDLDNLSEHELKIVFKSLGVY